MKLPLRDFSRLTGKQQLQPDIFPAQPLRMFRKPKYTHTSIKHVVLEHELERLRIIPFVSLVWNLCSVGIVLLHCYLILSLANLNSFSYISDISYFVWFWTLIFDMYDYDDEGVTESFIFYLFLFSLQTLKSKYWWFSMFMGITTQLSNCTRQQAQILSTSDGIHH